MNKVILMGRLVRDPEVRYSQGTGTQEGRQYGGSAKQTSGEPKAVARYTLAVNRRMKKQGEVDADFINCVTFGKSGEFAEKYFRKGQMVSVIGRLQVRTWDDSEGKKHWSTDVVIEEQYFAESKASTERGAAPAQTGSEGGFYPMSDDADNDDMPF